MTEHTTGTDEKTLTNPTDDHGRDDAGFTRQERLDFMFNSLPDEDWLLEENVAFMVGFYDEPLNWSRIETQLLKKKVYASLFTFNRVVKEARQKQGLSMATRRNGTTPQPQGPADQPSWRSSLKITTRGDPEESFPNINIILENHPAWQKETHPSNQARG